MQYFSNTKTKYGKHLHIMTNEGLDRFFCIYLVPQGTYFNIRLIIKHRIRIHHHWLLFTIKHSTTTAASSAIAIAQRPSSPVDISTSNNSSLGTFLDENAIGPLLHAIALVVVESIASAPTACHFQNPKPLPVSDATMS